MTNHTSTDTAITCNALFDSETGCQIGFATAAQVEASDNAGPEGHIVIDADGDVVEPGTWAANQPGTRRVFVA